MHTANITQTVSLEPDQTTYIPFPRSERLDINREAIVSQPLTTADKEKLQKTKDSQNILEDAALMSKIADGHNKSCQIIINKTIKPLYTLAYRVLHNQSEAEDVVQEAYIKLWMIASSWKPQAKVLSWLYRVAMNNALDRLRKRPISREITVDMNDPNISIRGHQSHEVDSAVQKEERTKKINILHLSIRQLPKHYQTILNLSYFQNMRTKNISEILQCSPRAAESLLKRARSRLKLILLKETICQTP